MNPMVTQVWDEVTSAYRYRWLALGLATLVVIVGWMYVFSLPDRYEAVASVFVDTRTSLKPVLQGLTADQDVDAQINFVRQSLLAGPSLLRVAREGGVLPSYRLDARLQEQLVSDMSTRIDISAHSANGREEDRKTAGSIYRVVYQDRNRERSLRVAGILVDTLVNETLGGKREGSQSAQQFLETQIKDLEKRLRSAEDRLRPSSQNTSASCRPSRAVTFAQLQRETEAAAISKRSSRKLSRVGQLLQISSTATWQLLPDRPGTRGRAQAGGGLDTLSRIEEAQAKLDDLLCGLRTNIRTSLRHNRRSRI